MGLDPVIRQILPRRLATSVEAAVASSRAGTLQAIRIRSERPLTILMDGTELFVTEDGRADPAGDRPLLPSSREVEETLILATEGSFYAVESELHNGYVTLPGGHRLGIAGQVVYTAGTVRSVKHVSSLQIRVAHQVPGCADTVLQHIVPPRQGRPWHTLIIGPPGSGKTTLLRDIARQLSDGTASRSGQGLQVGIADERSEIAGSYRGEAQLDVGRRTDVIDGAPKAVAIALLIRSMSPDVIVTDEIGAPEDAAAIADLIRCGVTLIASAHGSSLDEVAERPQIGSLLRDRAFERAIVLSKRRGVGTVERVVDLTQTLGPERRERLGAGRWSR